MKVVEKTMKPNFVGRFLNKRAFFVATLAMLGAGIVTTAQVNAEDHLFSVQVPEATVLEVSLKKAGTDTAVTGGTIGVAPSISTASFNEIGVDVTVGTSDNNGFSLAMNATGALEDASTGATIANLVDDAEGHANGYTCTVATGANCDFTLNSWGYKLTAATAGDATPTNYLPVPTTSTVVNNYTGTATNGVTTTFYFGARLNASQAAGTYTTTINFVATANVVPPHFMQDDDIVAYLAEAAPNVGDTISLQDNRDNTTYLIGKLADGKYWMLDNLALDLSTAGTLTSSDTNITSNWIAPAEITTWEENSSTDPKINTESKNIEQSYGSGNGKVGIYYNYCAATAGTYCMESGSDNASQDICPKGWRLPTGGSSGEYQALYTAYSSNATNFKNALHAGLSGYFYAGSARNQGSYGQFWSSTYSNATRMYDLTVIPTLVGPQESSYRHFGYSVRCVAKFSIADITSMQNLAELSPKSRTEVLASMTEGEAYQIKDSRDGTKYNIAKLADGNVWLLDNLALGATDLNEPISSANTNIPSGTSFTLPASSSTPNSYTEAQINTDSANLTFSYGDGEGKAGVYYNYCAATAGTYCYDSSSGTGNATADICPKGWRMPTGGTSGEYKALYTAYNSNATNFKNALRTPLSQTMSGYAVGTFWSSTYYSAGGVYFLLATSGVIQATMNVGRNGGYSVRCVFDPPVSRTVNYDKNTTNLVSGLPLAQTSEINAAQSITLSSNIPTSTGYDFLGWCSVQPTTSNDTDSCSGTTYAAGSQYTPGSATSTTLYAMWTKFYLQNVTSTTCTTAARTAYDKRDEQTYTIQKLADGKCWLLDNLRLDLSTTRSLTTANTNITSNWTAPAEITTWTSSFTDPKINTESKNIEQSYGSGKGKVGVYYNYCAATAGTYCMGSISGSGDASQDICPKGWRMPIGGSSGEYQALYTAYSSNAINFKNALRTPLSGYFEDGSASNHGSSGAFWSSTYENASAMSRLLVGAANVYPQLGNYRNGGYSVRCVLK